MFFLIKFYGDELGFDGDIRWLRLHSVFSASTLKRLKVNLNDNYNYALAA